MNFDEIRWENEYRLYLTQDKEEGRVPVNMVMSLGIP